jgi:hypothetical protein
MLTVAEAILEDAPFRRATARRFHRRQENSLAATLNNALQILLGTASTLL